MISTRLRLPILAFVLSLILFNAFALRQNLPASLAGDVDFRALYAAGAILRSHHATGLYDYDLERRTQNDLVSPHPGALPFLYPPYAAIPFAPLSALPYRAAWKLFLVLNLALLLAASLLLRPSLPALVAVSPALPLLLFLAFFPVTVALYQGQVSLILLVLLAAAHAALERRNPFVAGLLLALALIKFHVILPIILLYAIWRAWPLVRGFLTGAGAVALLSVAIEGPQGLRLWARTLLAASATGSIGADNPYTVFSTKMPNLHGLAVAMLGPSSWTTPLVVLASVAVLFVAARQPPSLPRAVVAALLVSYHLHVHDLTLLLLPIALQVNTALNRRQPDRLLTAASLLWITSPVPLLVIAASANPLFAPAMLPFLLAQSDRAHSLPA